RAGTSPSPRGREDRLECKDPPLAAHEFTQCNGRVAVVSPDVEPCLTCPDTMPKPFEKRSFCAAENRTRIVMPGRNYHAATQRPPQDPMRPNRPRHEAAEVFFECLPVDCHTPTLHS